MNGIDNRNESIGDRRIDEGNTPESMDGSRRSETGERANGDCSGKGCSNTKPPHDNTRRIGDGIYRLTDADRNEDERKRDLVVTEMRNIADRLESGELILMTAQSGKVMSPGRGKQKPGWEGMYGLSVVYK